MINKITAICKMLDKLAKTVIGISGFMFVIILSVLSIAYINGASLDEAELDLRPLVTSSTYLAYIWLGTLVVFVASGIYWFGREVTKGIAKARDTNLSAKEKGKTLFLWLFKH